MNPLSQNRQKMNLEMRGNKSMSGAGIKGFTRSFGDLKKKTLGWASSNHSPKLCTELKNQGRYCFFYIKKPLCNCKFPPRSSSLESYCCFKVWKLLWAGGYGDQESPAVLIEVEPQRTRTRSGLYQPCLQEIGLVFFNRYSLEDPQNNFGSQRTPS